MSSSSVSELARVRLGIDSESDMRPQIFAQENIVFEQEAPDPLVELLLSLGMLNISGITKIHIMVSHPKNKRQRATLFYSSPATSQP